MNLSLKNLLRFLAFIGMCSIILANFFPPGINRSALIISGCVAMALSPLHEKELLLASLQVVALSGGAIAITSWDPLIKSLLPLTLVAIFFSYFYFKGLLDERYKVIGALGMSLLGLGYAIEHPLVYLAGGIALTAYSSVSFQRGVSIAIYWAILNMFFILAVLYNITHYH